VSKSPPYYPAAFNFGADDVRFLREQGFTSLRLGVNMIGLLPEPGQVQTAYIDHLAETVREAQREGIYVLVDFHQDGFAPKYHGNGLPDWMAIDDGLPNPPDATFPLYYIQNPAMQRAFESFWANRPGPRGIGLQDEYLIGVRAVAKAFAKYKNVLGYELMNEPFPGADWTSCALGGCPDIEQAKLAPFAAKATAQLRRIAPAQQVYVEPFVLFNFGEADTSLPGKDTGDVLSFHSYAVDQAGEQGVVDRAVAAASRDDAPLMETEFGATNDVATLDRLTDQADTGIVSWMFWAYNENIKYPDDTRPASLDTVANLDVLKALVRPYPLALAGTPASLSYDSATHAMDLQYTTRSPDGDRYPRSLASVISVPRLQYPDGYRVAVTGATVTSRAGADRLTLRTDPGATAVTVRIAPAVP
jgi:endoglycosylceramidase